MHESLHNRSEVPWNGWDVLLLFCLYFVIGSAVVGVTVLLADSPPVPVGASTTTDHPLTQLLLQGRESGRILLVAFLCGVLIAPVTEELLFRLLLQGWLLKVFSGKVFDDRRTGNGFLSASASIGVTSILFAVLHAGARANYTADYLYYAMLGLGIANLMTTLFAVGYLIVIRSVSLRDLGLKRASFQMDFGLPVILFMLVVPVILSVHAWINRFYPDTVTDPIPLFLFSLALGSLIYKTGRLVPCILLHALLNGFSFIILAFGAS